MIGDEPLIEVVPLQQKGPDAELVTQVSMKNVEALGLLKVDFLGLRNLDVIDKAVALVGGVDIGAIPLDDRKTYEMLARADATGVFQFESSGMRDALRQVKPTQFEDLIALVALYRPGPMQYIPSYAARKNGREAITYIDKRLQTITGDSYGICIYQEQYMRIAKELAGFEPAEAETLRRAIGKKIHALMASLKAKFLDGCAANGVTPGVADQLWKDMESSQDYSFNKAHSACYALIAYRTAWLKANHPCEYMAALISSVMNTKDRVPLYVNACDEMGIEVLASGRQLVGGRLRGRRGQDPLRPERREERGGGGGAADRRRARRRRRLHLDLGLHRARRPAGREQALARVARQVRRARLDRRHAPRDARRPRAGARLRAEARPGPGHGAVLAVRGCIRLRRKRLREALPPISTAEYEKGELLRLEKETLGLYVSEHPLSAVRDQLRRKTDATLGELERRRDGETVTVGGIVSEVKHTQTKRGEPMVFLQLDDPTGSVEVVVFNSTFQAARELCVADRILVVKGRVDHKLQGETKVIASEVTGFEAVHERREVRFALDAREAPAGVIRELARLVREFPGESPVYLALDTSEGPKTYALGPEYRVRPDADFLAEARSLLPGATLV